MLGHWVELHPSREPLPDRLLERELKLWRLFLWGCPFVGT